MEMRSRLLALLRTEHLELGNGCRLVPLEMVSNWKFGQFATTSENTTAHNDTEQKSPSLRLGKFGKLGHTEPSCFPATFEAC